MLLLRVKDGNSFGGSRKSDESGPPDPPEPEEDEIQEPGEDDDEQPEPEVAWLIDLGQDMCILFINMYCFCNYLIWFSQPAYYGFFPNA